MYGGGGKPIKGKGMTKYPQEGRDEQPGDTQKNRKKGTEGPTNQRGETKIRKTKTNGRNGKVNTTNAKIQTRKKATIAKAHKSRSKQPGAPLPVHGKPSHASF